MKIIWFGIYDPKYPRNSILVEGLRQNGVEVIECREDWKDPQRYSKLVRRLRAMKGSADYIYAAYPAPVPTILAKLFTRKPVILDAFYSMYDAVVNDRREVSRFHPRALKLLVLDWLALMCADKIIVDTNEHKKYWSTWFGINPKKIHVVYVGALPANVREQKKEDGIFTVHWSGKYIPLQGVPAIVRAAKILSDEPNIRFRLLGWNKETEADRLIEEYNLKNVERIGRVPLEEYYSYMSTADVVLGIFGETAKAKRVIPNKVFEALVMKKPTITMDTPAIREAFTADEVFLTANAPQDIATAVRKLYDDVVLRRSLSEKGYAKMSARYMPEQLGKELVTILNL